MQNIKLKIKQLFCWHEYDSKDIRGYDTPKHGAKCTVCGKVNK